MTSERQKARARRTEAFWRTKLDRAPSPFDRAHAVYDWARAAVNDLPPAERQDGWAQVEATIAELHDRWADERAVKRWARWVAAATSPNQRVWHAWRRLWAAVSALDEDERDGAWQLIEARMEALVVTLSDIRDGPNSGAERRRIGGFTLRRRGRAGARARREESVPGSGANSGPEITLRNKNHGRSSR